MAAGAKESGSSSSRSRGAPSLLKRREWRDGEGRTSARDVYRSLERVDGVFEGEAVRDERLEVDEAPFDETCSADGVSFRYVLTWEVEDSGKRTDCFRVLVGVAVLQLDVDLVGAQVHERERLEVLARADDEHGRAKLARIARRLHTRLDARALERELEPRRETRRRFDLSRDVFGLDAALDEDGLDAGD